MQKKDPRSWSIKDLEYWAKVIEEKANEFGLSYYPYEIEICSGRDMIGYMAYTGIPAHYPHWSFGKAFEKIQTLYNYGIIGLPYEMVINSNPCLAYLMRDNTLAMQILTIMHAPFGHGHMFKNNLHFAHTRPELVLGQFKARADRVRSYIEDPNIGPRKVEEFLDAAHALSLQRSRYLQIKKLTPKEQKKRLMKLAEKKKKKIDLSKIPLVPEEDILLFIRDHNPYLEDWQKDILTIVDEEAEYFLPQLETKIVNEGFATFCHYHLLKQLNLPDALWTEVDIIHNQVISRPKIALTINPYHLGFNMFQEIEKQFGKEKVFEAADTCRDTSFLREFLTQELMDKLGFFAHQQIDTDRIVSAMPDREDWKKIKEVMIANTGVNAIPAIKIEDANYHGTHELYSKHYWDGRLLLPDYEQGTTKYLYQLWQKRPVHLETVEAEAEKKSFYSSEIVVKVQSVIHSYDGSNFTKKILKTLKTFAIRSR